MQREQALVETFVQLADTLVDDFDIIDFLQGLAERCVELLEVSEAGVMLGAADGGLRHAACSSERMRVVELFELQVEQGPCFDAYKQNMAVRCDSAEEAETRWPQFAPRAIDAGFVAVSAIPLRLRTDVIGALNLFSNTPGALDDSEVRVAQAMADIATIGILQERLISDSHTVVAQLEGALDSRVLIEQAKGIIAEHNKVNVDDAFTVLRSFARSQNRLLGQTAQAIVDGSLQPERLGVR